MVITASDCDGRIAVAGADGTWSYARLDAAAAAIAARLQQSGARPECLVGLCLERRFERIAAMMGIWRAGAAVLALDPGWPPARLAAIVAESEAPLVLVEPGVNLGGAAVCLEVATLAEPEPRVARGTELTGDALAYVVYTSGSTGTPEGVEITHGNLAHLVRWHIEHFGVTRNDRIGHVAGLGFDAAFWEVCPALAAGATLVLPDEATRTSPARLQRWLIDERITMAFVPTVLAELLLGLAWPPETALRLLLTGGEALRAHPPAGLPFRLINNYGPSECTVVATSGEVAPDGIGAPSIGWPIDRVQVHLLDEAGAPVPDGAAGEVVIGGAGVGRGYRHAREATRARFLPDGCGTIAGPLYRTGDVGRRGADGNLQFLGRTDEQVQVNGVRVEPAEVARALSAHPAVAWCTVAGQGAARQGLAAYLVLRPGQAPTADAMRAFLRTQLPEAMVPATFAAIASVPLTASGKLDREALTAPGFAAPLARAAFRAAAGVVEVRLAAIMGELLGGMAVGADDNFFLLGGHSMLGTQAVIRMSEAFGVRLPLRTLFASPTVAELAPIVTRLVEARVAAMSEAEAELLLTP